MGMSIPVFEWIELKRKGVVVREKAVPFLGPAKLRFAEGTAPFRA